MERKFSEFRESDKSLKQHWGKFKDPISHMCLSCTVITSWCLTQDMAGSNPFTLMTNIFSH